MRIEPDNFLEAVVLGKAKIEDIDDWVDAWHDRDKSIPNFANTLHQELGMSWRDYQTWVRNPNDLVFLDDLVRWTKRYMADTLGQLQRNISPD